MSPRLAPTLLLACLAAAPATKPAADPPATDDLVSLGNDLVRFHAPPAPRWSLSAAAAAAADNVTFTTDDRTAQFNVQFAKFGVEPATGPALVKALKEKRQKEGNVVVMPPTVERDKRFDLVIHEKFKVGDAVEDEVHLFKAVGPKTVMVAASTTAADPDEAKADLEAAKAAVASAKFNKPGAAKPKRP